MPDFIALEFLECWKNKCMYEQCMDTRPLSLIF